MQRIPNDVLYFETGPDNAVTHRVRPGETFEVQTQINRGPWIDKLRSKAQRDHWYAKLTGGNPSSGCIHVHSAKPGDMLAVKIGAIELDPVGYTAFGGRNGAMPGWMEIGHHHRIVNIRNGVIEWDRKLKLRAQPMLGFVGVAPAGQRFHNGWAGTYGGNMDAQEVTTGATLYLRVQCPGALLHVGDMHAIQGDGEICGAGGIEAQGRVKLSCKIAGSPAPKSLNWPRFENATHIGVIAQAKPAEDALRHALADLIKWLAEDYGQSAGDAYLLLGQVLESRITQLVNPTFTAVAKINKKYLRRSRVKR